jgi:hypothetical protein
VRDERLLIGFLAFHALVAAPGVLTLYALGFVRPRPLSVVGAAGPAFAVGVVILGVPLIALAVVGVGVGTGALLAVLAAVTLGTGVAALRTHRRMNPVTEPAGAAGRHGLVELAIERLVLAFTGAYLALGSLAFANLPTLWDDANIWSLKALGLYHHAGLTDELARNPRLSGVHLDYPILQPLVEASFFRAIGGVDLRLWHLELWVLFGALIWTLAWLLAPLGRRWLWAFVIATLAPSGILISNITLGDADTTMAALVGCATLSFGIWLERGQRAHAVLGALFLAGAANVKNEGLAFGVAIAAALLIANIGRLRGRWKDLALSGGIVVTSVLAWQLWVLGNDAATRGTPPPWKVINDPGFLIDRSGYLWRGIEQIAHQLTNVAEWGLLVPALLVVASVLLIVGQHRRVAAFYLLAWLLAFSSVAYTYWVTPFGDLGGFEQRTGPRIALGIVFVAGAGLAHLIQLATAERDALADREAVAEAPVAARA